MEEKAYSLSYAERFMNEEDFEVVEKLKELYLTSRQRFIIQYKTKKGESGWRVPYGKTVVSNGKSLGRLPMKLSDGWLYTHLKGEQTIGVYSMKYFSKFICFDVDLDSEDVKKGVLEEGSREAALNIVSVLEEMNIRREDIHVSFSGSKGYHVEIFFDNTIATESLKRFYVNVITKAGYTHNQVEFRPSCTEGVKIPLGIHRRTESRCWYVDNTNLNPIKDFGYVLGINQVSAEDFVSEQLDNGEDIILNEKEAEEFGTLIEGIKLTAVELYNIKKEMQKILDNEILLEKDSRNRVTFILSMYLRDKGEDAKDVENTINGIMNRTQTLRPTLITPSKSKVIRETRKIVKYVYSKGATLNRPTSEVKVYKEEILDVLSIRKWEHKKLYLSMMLYAKKVGEVSGEFRMSYSIMTAMGNTASRSRLLTAVSALETSEKVSIVSRSEMDLLQTQLKGRVIHKANKYKINKVFNQEGESILIKDDEDESSFERIVLELFEEEELRVLLPKNQFYKVKSYVS